MVLRVATKKTNGTQGTQSERLDRLECEEGERDTIKELETKVHDEKTNMAVANALDEIRSRNARWERIEKEGDKKKVDAENSKTVEDTQRDKENAEDTEFARQAFTKKRKLEKEEIERPETPAGTIDRTSGGRKER
ncbi:uncharacterized protein BDZ99DRAFT_523362 [Mytilinidion resinicola]|uniref:Uncharacterized protein n=1 Tax=Mytilinidion resinicola TaxID=574789 RepID=A0A6A6YDW2_9PEZI|nr:uncharacterized protein BDZ99DRAFT_523362 [Mytilinidion resinicola]KAF2806789.1 hypothetical protein BDZ99DRAFT_523362 [Mytilinidion resinicola]